MFLPSMIYKTPVTRIIGGMRAAVFFCAAAQCLVLFPVGDRPDGRARAYAGSESAAAQPVVQAPGGASAQPATQPAVQSAPDQQVREFSLAGYGDRGRKTWDIYGKSANIFEETVKLDDISGNLYGDGEDIQLTADRGDFDKVSGKVHLKDNVVITTSGGAILTTDSLNWDRKNQLVDTKDMVNIRRDNITVEAVGAQGRPDLKTISLEKDVTINIKSVRKREEEEIPFGFAQNERTGKQPASQEQVIIVCDGPMEINYEKNIAVLKNNVRVERADSVIYSDIMDVYFLPAPKDKAPPKEPQTAPQTSALMGSKIDRIVARGHVRVIRGENVSYSDEAVYNARDGSIIMSGRPRLVIVPLEEKFHAPAGN